MGKKTFSQSSGEWKAILKEVYKNCLAKDFMIKTGITDGRDGKTVVVKQLANGIRDTRIAWDEVINSEDNAICVDPMLV